jgi:alanine-synthesizing transaminase
MCIILFTIFLLVKSLIFLLIIYNKIITLLKFGYKIYKIYKILKNLFCQPFKKMNRKIPFIKKSQKLKNVCYDVRGPVLEKAKELENKGEKIIKLNIGNPFAFGFETPSEILKEVKINLSKYQGYTDAKGIPEARQAILESYKKKNIKNISIEDIYIGNGVSELILMSIQALLNNKDEVLIPQPDYPLWSAAVSLSGGKSVFYHCDEKQEWLPDIKDIKRKITSKTKAIVIINPNNPTGALWPKETLEKIIKIAKEKNLVVLADEIYDEIIYEKEKHFPIASLSNDLLFLTFGGLSKNYYFPGIRSGWLLVSGNKKIAKDYIEGLNILSNMRLCSNIAGQLAIKPALEKRHRILKKHKEELKKQRDLAYKLINQIPGLSSTRPKATFYIFPKIDIKKFNIKDDEKFVLDFLLKEKILLVAGKGFNWPKPDHFRIVFLPKKKILLFALQKLKKFLDTYKQY